MIVTLSGMTMLVSAPLSLKTAFSMTVTLSGIVKRGNPQLRKVLSKKVLIVVSG
jgi:hypothetical protein